MAITLPARSRLDAALDAFEKDWATFVNGGPSLEGLLTDHGLADSPEAIVECIRVEIDRLCGLGTDVDLREYFRRFPCLNDEPQLARTLAFEDFRSRWSRGYVCRRDRWDWIPGIDAEEWFSTLPAAPPAVDRTVGQHLARERPARRVPPPRAGQRLGEFDLLAVLGKGAFSTVFLARQLTLEGRYVALKVVSRPMREPAHLARLLHSGIVPLYSYHRIEPYWVLCMPYAGALTLADWQASPSAAASRDGQSLVATIAAANERLTVTAGQSAADSAPALSGDEQRAVRDWSAAGSHPLGQVARLDAGRLAVWFFGRLSSALGHAHLRGIVHGDLKPANVLVRHDGEPALIDFNLSHGEDAAVRSWVGGTLPYMAPEQLRALCGDRCETGPAADVYALGALTYEFAEGRLPFPAPASPSPADLEAALVQRRRAPVPEFRSRITPGLRSILRKCLAADATDRYPSAVELAEDVEREERHLPLIHAREPLWTGRLPKLARRHPRAFSTTTTGLVAGVIVLALLAGFAGHRDQARRLAATESFDSFLGHSDRALTRFLTAEGEPERLSRRQELAGKAFEVYLPPGAGSADDWRSSPRFAKLTPQEQSRVEERLFVLAALTLNDAWDTRRSTDSATVSQTLDRCRQVFESLPPWARETRTFALARQRWDASQGPDQPVPDLNELTGDAVRHPADRLVCAIALLGAERFDDALALLDDPALAESLGAAAWLSAARAQLGKGELREAVMSCTFAIARMPDSVAAPFNRGLAHYRLGEVAAAAVDFSATLAADSAFVPALVNRSFCHAAAGAHERAVGDLDAALSLAPGSNQLLVMRSRQLRLAGRDQEARQDFEQALRTAPETLDDCLSLALAWLPDDPRKALATLEQADERFGPDPAIAQSLAHVYAEHLADPQRALEALDRLLRERPLFLPALAGRGVLRARGGQVDEALADAARIESQPRVTPPATAYQVACIYALAGASRPELKGVACRRLAEAVRRGYGAELLDTDADLAPLREHSEFQSLRQVARLLSRNQ